MDPRWTTEVERITDKWHARYSVSRFILIVILIWFFVWGIYALSVWSIDFFAGQQVSKEFSGTFDNFMIFHGIGMILATMITPLFVLHFIIDALESHSQDKGLIRAFLKVETIREGRRKLKKLGMGTEVKDSALYNSEKDT